MVYAWKPEHSLGDSTVDEQHRRLFGLAGMIAEACNGDRNERIAHEAFLALHQHANQHFEDEEQLLAAVGSPLLEEHKREHEILMTEFKQLWMASRLNLLDDVLRSLSDWLAKRVIPHMLEADPKARWEHLGVRDAAETTAAPLESRSAA